MQDKAVFIAAVERGDIAIAGTMLCEQGVRYLSLTGCIFVHWEPATWKHLVTCLQQSDVVSLDLRDTDIWQVDAKYCGILTRGLKDTKITSLLLGWRSAENSRSDVEKLLSRFTGLKLRKRLDEFSSGLAKSHIQDLTISHCAFMEPRHYHEFLQKLCGERELRLCLRETDNKLPVLRAVLMQALPHTVLSVALEVELLEPAIASSTHLAVLSEMLESLNLRIHELRLITTDLTPADTPEHPRARLLNCLSFSAVRSLDLSAAPALFSTMADISIMRLERSQLQRLYLPDVFFAQPEAAIVWLNVIKRGSLLQEVVASHDVVINLQFQMALPEMSIKAHRRPPVSEEVDLHQTHGAYGRALLRKLSTQRCSVDGPFLCYLTAADCVAFQNAESLDFGDGIAANLCVDVRGQALETHMSRGVLALAPMIHTLNFSACDINDERLESILPLVNRCVSLKELILDDNQLTRIGLQLLVQKLPKQIAHLSLRANHIEVDDQVAIFNRIDGQMSSRPNQVVLTGNGILSRGQPGGLVRFLLVLLRGFDRPVREFLKTTYRGLTRVSERTSAATHHFEVVTESQEVVAIPLTKDDNSQYNLLRQGRTRGSFTSEQDFYTELLGSLNANHSEIPEDLLAWQPSTEVSEEQRDRKQVKRLLCYHPEAPLKAWLRRHPIFAAEREPSLPCLLYPSELLTREKGRAYLIVNHRERHASLGYEYLTSSGQRLLKVAHLTVREEGSGFTGSKSVQVSFYNKNFREFQEYKDRFIICSFEVARSKLKLLHQEVLRESLEGVKGNYKWLITGSVQRRGETEKKVQNCLSWVTDNMTQFLHIRLKIGLYNPNTVIKNLLKNPEEHLASEQIDSLRIVGSFPADSDILSTPNRDADSPSQNRACALQ